MIKANFISRLIKGNIINNENVSDSLKFFDIKFISDKFVVILFYIDGCKSIINSGSEQEWAMARLITTNTIENFNSKLDKVYVLELDRERLAVLVNLNDDTDKERVDSLVDMAEQVRTQLTNEFGFELTISIGNMHKGLNSITESYKEALSALNYKITKGSNSIICFRDIQEDNLQYYYPLEEELKIMNCIKSGKMSSTEDIVNNIFHENFVNRHLPYRLIQCLYFDIMSTAIKTLNEIKIDYSQIFDTGFDPVFQLLECQTVIEMHQTVLNIYKHICCYIKDNRKSHNMELMDRITEYVGEYYSDVNLSVAKIAEEMGINSSYLSSFFKEQIKCNLTGYINEVRLKKAEELFYNKKLTINEIAENIGYGSVNTFIRVFKKERGITPGEYKNR